VSVLTKINKEFVADNHVCAVSAFCILGKCKNVRSSQFLTLVLLNFRIQCGALTSPPNSCHLLN